ncbi:hypothetical protein GCM10011533_11160 [Streptosporangium jomthongense]|uniref:DNA topoisomerase I n=1 Tax=Marinobacter aromaticivorans TaxID=1494078 RepID=A0ABW2ISI3_9GAMM|nr:hypothetical protein [Marinobacter aromaticivorans]GGE60375.1 hypothetical protein GCM10011533_11160 [Streptosporangium jomthongense]
MNTITIVLALAAVVVISIAVIVITQMREKARIERVRKITALEDSYKRCSRLLSELPGQYLTPDLKLLILKRMDDVCNDLAGLKSALPVEKWRDAVRQRKTQIRENRDEVQPVRIDSPEKANYVKELLQNLFKMLEAMHKSGRIDGATAKKNLKYVLFLVHKTHADLHVFQARDHIRQNQIRKAIHAYHLASTEMGKSRDNPLAMKAVKSFRTRIKELEAMNLQDGSSRSEAPESTLDKQWDNFLHDTEWKKKADYDD